MLKLKRSFTVFHGSFFRLHELRSLILYSTSIASKDGLSSSLMVGFLVRSLGFSEDEAVSLASNPKVSHRLKSIQNHELVVDFLKSSGFDATHIRKLVASNPTVLRNNVEKTLKPKIGAFQDLGLSGSDLGLVISQHPHVLTRSLKGHIIPALEILKSVIGCSEQLIRFMLKTKSQNLLSYYILTNLPANVLLLQSYGLPTDKIKRFVLQRSHVLLRNPQWFEGVVKTVEEKLGIPPTSGMFMYGIYALCWKRGDKLESWIQVFMSHGWSRSKIFVLLRRHPLALTLSEKEVSLRLKYFMGNLGCGSDNLTKSPTLLSYSIEKRIAPRNAVMKALKEKQLLKRDLGLSTFVCISESKFMEKYVLPFKDTLPELYRFYTETVSGFRGRRSKA